MRISIKSLLIIIWGLGGICSVRGEVFGELNLGWNLYLNPQGKYQLVSAPTSENPYNWEAEERIDYNAFELGWAILGWRGMLNNDFKTTVSFIVEDVEEAGLNFQLERAYLERSWGENFFLDFQAGYFLTSWMEWIRGYLWDWDWLAHPVVEELGLVPSSQLGILVNGGWGNGKAKLGVKLAGLTEPPFDSNYNRWELGGIILRGESPSRRAGRSSGRQVLGWNIRGLNWVESIFREEAGFPQERYIYWGIFRREFGSFLSYTGEIL